MNFSSLKFILITLIHFVSNYSKVIIKIVENNPKVIFVI